MIMREGPLSEQKSNPHDFQVLGAGEGWEIWINEHIAIGTRNKPGLFRSIIYRAIGFRIIKTNELYSLRVLGPDELPYNGA